MKQKFKENCFKKINIAKKQHITSQMFTFQPNQVKKEVVLRNNKKIKIK